MTDTAQTGLRRSAAHRVSSDYMARLWADPERAEAFRATWRRPKVPGAKDRRLVAKHPCAALGAWLEHHGVTYREFSALVGVSKQAISNWINHGKLPYGEVMARVTAATNGAITAADWEGSGEVERRCFGVTRKFQ